jgi:hypothetical protein
MLDIVFRDRRFERFSYLKLPKEEINKALNDCSIVIYFRIAKLTSHITTLHNQGFGEQSTPVSPRLPLNCLSSRSHSVQGSWAAWTGP